MSRMIFVAAMRHAAVLLFLIAVMVPVMTLATVFVSFASTPPEGGPMLGGAPVDRVLLFNSLVSALSTSVWPLLGAAVIWRVDRHLGNRSNEA